MINNENLEQSNIKKYKKNNFTFKIIQSRNL